MGHSATPISDRSNDVRFFGYTLGDESARQPEPSPELFEEMDKFMAEAIEWSKRFVGVPGEGEVNDTGLAEELAQDALVDALTQWPCDGTPRHPTEPRRMADDWTEDDPGLRSKLREG